MEKNGVDFHKTLLLSIACDSIDIITIFVYKYPFEHTKGTRTQGKPFEHTEKKVNILFIPSGWMRAVDKPDPETLRRLEQGLLLWWTDRYDLILVTGGMFRPEEVQTISAGQILGSWLVSHGVPPKKIIVEGHSLDTYQNVQFGMMVLRQRIGTTESPTITVVSHWQHALRIALTFWMMWDMKVRLVPLWYLGSLRLLLVEMIAFLVHVIDPLGTGQIARKNRYDRQCRKA